MNQPTVRIAGLDVVGLSAAHAERLRGLIAARLSTQLEPRGLAHDVALPGFEVRADSLESAADAVATRILAELDARSALGGAT